MRSNYALSSPNNETKEYYHDKIMEFIVNYPDIVEKLITSINVNDNEDQSYEVKCRVASSILLESVLKNQIHKIGLLISTVNSVRKCDPILENGAYCALCYFELWAPKVNTGVSRQN